MRSTTHLQFELIHWLFLFHIVLSPVLCFSEQTAQVVMLKGQVKSITNGNSIELKQGDWVEENAEIQTEEKSFAKLELKDRSQLTIGPKSKMKISKGPEKGTGLINLIGGQLRANVQKAQTGTAPKLIIKTKNAAMGVRGTQFEASFNQASGLSNLLTFEGQVACIQVETGQTFSLSKLSGELSSGQVTLANPGQYTAVNAQGSAPMEPVIINPTQLNSLRANETLLAADSGPTNKEHYQSPVPPGASAGALTNTSSELENSMEKSLGPEGVQLANELINTENPSGEKSGSAEFSDSGIRQGGYYDPRVGYIVPPANSPVDPNTGLSIPTTEAGGVSPDGHYLPPEGLAITDDGKFVAAESLNSANGSTTNNNSATSGVGTTASTTSVPVAVTSTEEAKSYMSMEMTSYNVSAITATSTDSLVDKIVQTNTAAISDSQNTISSVSTVTDVSFNVSISN